MERPIWDNTPSVEPPQNEGTEVWNMGLYDQLTSLEGRINRLRFFALSLLVSVCGFLYALIIGIATFWIPDPFWIILITILFLPIYYMRYALTVKRLQDMGRGGGWITYAQITVVLDIIYGLTPLGSEIEFFMEITSLLVWLPLGLVCLFESGDSGPNNFGPDPIPFQSPQERGVQV